MTDWLNLIAGIGRILLVVAVLGLVGSIGGVVLFALRRPGTEEGPPLEIDPLRSPGSPTPALRVGGRRVGRWKGVQRSTGFVSIRSLVEGTASPQERLMVLGIHVAMLSFWLVFISVALIVLPSSPLKSLLAAAIPTAWLATILRSEWQELSQVRRQHSRQ